MVLATDMNKHTSTLAEFNGLKKSVAESVRYTCQFCVMAA